MLAQLQVKAVTSSEAKMMQGEGSIMLMVVSTCAEYCGFMHFVYCYCSIALKAR